MRRAWGTVKTEHGIKWTEVRPGSGRPLGGSLFDTLADAESGLAFALRPGDQVPASEALRLFRESRHQQPLAGRIEQAKEALTAAPTITTGDTRARARESIAFEDRLTATKKALAGKA